MVIGRHEEGGGMPLEWHMGGFGAAKRKSILEGGVCGGGVVRRGRQCALALRGGIRAARRKSSQKGGVCGGGTVRTGRQRALAIRGGGGGIRAVLGGIA